MTASAGTVAVVLPLALATAAPAPVRSTLRRWCLPLSPTSSRPGITGLRACAAAVAFACGVLLNCTRTRSAAASGSGSAQPLTVGSRTWSGGGSRGGGPSPAAPATAAARQAAARQHRGHRCHGAKLKRGPRGPGPRFPRVVHSSGGGQLGCASWPALHNSNNLKNLLAHQLRPRTAPRLLLGCPEAGRASFRQLEHSDWVFRRFTSDNIHVRCSPSACPGMWRMGPGQHGTARRRRQLGGVCRGGATGA